MLPRAPRAPKVLRGARLLCAMGGVLLVGQGKNPRTATRYSEGTVNEHANCPTHPRHRSPLPFPHTRSCHRAAHGILQTVAAAVPDVPARTLHSHNHQQRVVGALSRARLGHHRLQVSLRGRIRVRGVPKDMNREGPIGAHSHVRGQSSVQHPVA